MTLPKSRDSADHLLPPVIRSTNALNNEPVVEHGWCRATTVILIVLFVCGMIAFGLSAVVWNFYDDSGNETETTTDTTTTSKFSIITIILVFVCGFVAFGLSIVAWRLYKSLENDEENNITTSTSATFQTLSELLTKGKSSNLSTSLPTSGKRIIGYFTYFDSTEITKSQLSKLTHAVFAYLQMNSDGKIEYNSDKEETKFLSLRNKSKRVEPNVKVLFSIGGYENSQCFSSVIDDPKKKRSFIDSIASFIKKNQIDGVDLFWRWPRESDKFKYSAFLKELKRRLKKEGKQYILSIEVPPVGVGQYEAGFDLDEILEHVDFVNVLSMDYYGPWPNKWGTPAGPSAPLYSGVSEKKNFSVDYTMQYYIRETNEPTKFNIVIPFSVRLWKNVKEPLQPGNEAIRHIELKDGKAEGAAYMTQWTVEHEGWKLSSATWDEPSKSSYLWNPKAKTYLTFESEQSMKAKINYVNEMNLGGVWIWSVGMDDERNTLLNKLCSNELCSNNSENAVRYIS